VVKEGITRAWKIGRTLPLLISLYLFLAGGVGKWFLMGTWWGLQNEIYGWNWTWRTVCPKWQFNRENDDWILMS
jgi:hypothetical protein